MTSQGDSVKRVLTNARPTRNCKKRITIDIDSDNSASEDIPKKTAPSKRAKLRRDSDESFRIDEEEEEKTPRVKKKIKKENESKEKKVRQTTKAARKSPKSTTKGNRKRIKQEIKEEVDSSCKPLKTEVSQEEYNVPTKKIKTEGNILEIKKEELSELDHKLSDQEDVKPFIKEELHVKSTFLKKEKDCKPSLSDVKYEPGTSNHNSSTTEGGDWKCNNANCGGYNYAWRQQCFRCRSDRPRSNCKAEYKSATISHPKVEQNKENFNIAPGKCEFANANSEEDLFLKECRLVTKRSNVPYHIVLNILKLFNSDATVPFIVRYRSHMTGGLSAQEIRQLKQHHDSVKKVIEKAKNMKKKLESLGYLDAPLSKAIDACVTQSELEYLHEPFKVLKTSKLVKVIDMGLSTPAEKMLYGNGRVSLEQYIKEELSLNEIIELIVYYVGEMMSKDSELMDKVRELIKYERIIVASKQKTASKKKVTENVQKKNRPEDVYSNYYDFECPYNRVRPHQILAINRGESEQCLQVSLTIPPSFQHKLCHFARNKWYFRGMKYELRESIFKKALEFMYNKRITPYTKRLIRSELTKQGEKASLEVFSSNLKYLLLTPPIRNVTVCSVDPGYSHGCKIAILNPQQTILKTDVLYLNNPHHFGFKDCAFVRHLNEFNVDLLVVGNGKGCRDVEFQISQLISSNCLNKSFKYIVASENGISVYSCSPEAKEEYPNLSPNIISAISLAKRVQDPLCELVKVEPKHLGVGMYQHDINAKKLDSVLDDVVSECVSIVGVDVNNAPLRILKRVAGLTESKAKIIIETREKEGSFLNREELKKVKGIGPKTFQQCAGFIKVIPGTCLKEKKNVKSSFNYLDQTIIHPEDYRSAKKILEMNNLRPELIGSSECMTRLRTFMNNESIPGLAQKLNIPFETVKLILEALTSPLDYDIRSTFDKPLFRNKATSINDFISGSVVSGQIENVTHFGAFVDLGIECSGLIPHKNMLGKDLHLGQIVKVKITEIDTRKMRISLLLVSIESLSSTNESHL